MTLSLEGLPTKAKEAPSAHEVRLALLDTNPVFQSLGDKIIWLSRKIIIDIQSYTSQLYWINIDCLFKVAKVKSKQHPDNI